MPQMDREASFLPIPLPRAQNASVNTICSLGVTDRAVCHIFYRSSFWQEQTLRNLLRRRNVSSHGCRWPCFGTRDITVQITTDCEHLRTARLPKKFRRIAQEISLDVGQQSRSISCSTQNVWTQRTTLFCVMGLVCRLIFLHQQWNLSTRYIQQ